MFDPNKAKILQRYEQDYDDVVPSLGGEYVKYVDVINLLKTLFRNSCGEWAPKALRYLAENERPTVGESFYNTIHLYQLADEIEAAYMTIKKIQNGEKNVQ